MKNALDPKPYRVSGKTPFKILKARTSLKQHLYKNAADLKAKLTAYQEAIDELQQKMYAQDRIAMLLIFQAMDAAGKDGTLRHVMSGINPGGVEVYSFKRPSDEELDHDFLWRCAKVTPQRGHIGIFNRSYYEEVLVCKVHPEIVTKYQRLPSEATQKMGRLWKNRYRDIANYEAFLECNGTKVVKFFLHVSKEEQKNRFIERIDTPSKNWKFNADDIKERAHWDAYMSAYEDAINETATPEAPWYVVPADDKGDMRIIVSAAILQHLQSLNLRWPTLPAEQVNALSGAKAALLAES